MSVPGVGPIVSSAMVAAVGTGEGFVRGRDFAAWLGIVPKQISTGDRTILGPISKQGKKYLRKLFVQAAWVVLVKPQSWERHGLKSVSESRRLPLIWLDGARLRRRRFASPVAASSRAAARPAG